MFRKIAFLAASAAIAVLLAGCSEPAKVAPIASNDAEKGGELTIVESGWSTNGHICYGALVRNDSDSFAEFSKIRITARDDAGSVIASDTHTMSIIAPHATVAVGSFAGNGEDFPATVDIEAAGADWVSSPRPEPAAYEVGGVSERVDDYRTTYWIGEVRNISDVDADMTAVTIILRDGGSIVGGWTSYVYDLAAGASASFEVTGQSVPDHDSFEAYAMTWA